MFAIKGQPLNISAKDWNALLADLRKGQRQQGRRTQGLTSRGGGGNQLPQGWAWVRNDTGGNVDQFDVLALSEPIIFDAASFAVTRNETPDFKGITPTSSYYGKWGVLRAPAQGSSGGTYPTLVPAVISGCTWARATVNHASDVACEIVAGSTTLETNMTGSARILHKESGTGSNFAVLIRLGDPVTSFIGISSAGIAANGGTGSVTAYTANFSGTTGRTISGIANETGIAIAAGGRCIVTDILGALYAEPWECP